MAIRSVQTQGTTGIVVTASHNPAEDNGVKLVEPSGYMLDQSWEGYADDLAIAKDASSVCDVLKKILDQELPQQEMPAMHTARVWIGHDTRPSCRELVKAACDGVESCGARAEVKGLLSTPQLHWMVRQTNQHMPSTETDYYNALSQAFQMLSGSPSNLDQAKYVDCANGVGAAKMERLLKHLPELHLRLRNTGEGPLNGRCGADFVQKGDNGVACAPANFQDVPKDSRCASFDGDADRVVFFSHTADGFNLLDGDRIAVLAALLIRSLIADLNDSSNISVGIVQTAYANGSSTKYMREALGLTVLLAKTGVKHLHHLAETFDIGIYFEANGHGTVLFKESFLTRLKTESKASRAASDLLNVAQMVNQAVGDAISGLLLVIVTLQRQGWSLKQWAALYSDLPSCMLKVKVPDRSIFETTDAETKVISPQGLQAKINRLIGLYKEGRSFVRPSGTEDVVRIYAEAETKESALELATKVARAVEELSH